jgi:hypothetical protein
LFNVAIPQDTRNCGVSLKTISQAAKDHHAGAPLAAPLLNGTAALTDKLALDR